jgi:hypothetical protein
MAALTYFVALRFDRNDEGEFRTDDAQECPDAAAAIQRAEDMSKRSAGAIAFSRTGDPATGEFEAAEILQKFGQIPPDHLLKGYDDPELPLKEIVKLLDILEPLVVHRMNIGELPFTYAGPDRRARLSDVLVLKAKIAAQQRAMREMAKMAEDNGEV